MQTTKIVITLGVAVLSVPALAAQPQSDIRIYGMKHVADGFEIEVPYHDLDLRQPAQVRILSARVGKAARSVCAPLLYTPRFDAAQQRACEDGAISDAAPQMALARKRAQEFARTGHSSIPEVAVALRSAF